LTTIITSVKLDFGIWCHDFGINIQDAKLPRKTSKAFRKLVDSLWCPERYLLSHLKISIGKATFILRYLALRVSSRRTFMNAEHVSFFFLFLSLCLSLSLSLSLSLAKKRDTYRANPRLWRARTYAGKSGDAPLLLWIPFHLVNALCQSSGTKLRQRWCYVRSRYSYRDADRERERERERERGGVIQASYISPLIFVWIVKRKLQGAHATCMHFDALFSSATCDTLWIPIISSFYYVYYIV